MDSPSSRYRSGCGKITRRWLAQGNYFNALPVNFNFKLIDSIVIVQYLARQLAVAFHQRQHGAVKRRFGFAAQQQHAIA